MTPCQGPLCPQHKAEQEAGRLSEADQKTVLRAEIQSGFQKLGATGRIPIGSAKEDNMARQPARQARQVRQPEPESPKHVDLPQVEVDPANLLARAQMHADSNMPMMALSIAEVVRLCNLAMDAADIGTIRQDNDRLAAKQQELGHQVRKLTEENQTLTTRISLVKEALDA